MRGLVAALGALAVFFVGLGVYFTFQQQRRAEEARRQAERARDAAGSYVIGREAARAAAAERRRVAEGGHAPSPMPKAGYDLGKKEHGLLFAAWQDFEADLVKLCRAYAAKNEADRASLRASLTRADFYTLLHFAKRAAVFAVRANSIATCRDGFTALAMIERDRIDYRDFLGPCGLLDHATNRLGGDRDAEFQRARRLAEPGIAEMLWGFRLRSEPLRELRAWRKSEYGEGAAFGLVDTGAAKYAPKTDLTAIGVEIADFLDAHRYEYPRLTIATDVPAVWFGTKDEAGVKALLGRTTGAISLSADPVGEERLAHTFLVFVTEAASREDGDALVRAAQGRPETHALQAGSVFGIVVAKSGRGIRPFETPEGLATLLAGIQRILDEHAEK